MFRTTIILLMSAAASANTIGTLSIPTTGLTGSGYAVDFQFIDGDGAGDGNNTVSLTNFTFGGGSFGSPAITGGSAPASRPSTSRQRSNARSPGWAT